MRTKPLKEKCSYYFNQTLVFYEMDPGNTVNRGSCPGWSRLLMRKAEKSSVHSRAFLPSFITCRVVCQCCRNHSLGGLRYLIRGRKSSERRSCKTVRNGTKSWSIHTAKGLRWILSQVSDSVWTTTDTGYRKIPLALAEEGVSEMLDQNPRLRHSLL